MTTYINRHDRRISHIYASTVTSKTTMYTPLCNGAGIWANSYIKNKNYWSSLGKYPMFHICKQCSKAQRRLDKKATE